MKVEGDKVSTNWALHHHHHHHPDSQHLSILEHMFLLYLLFQMQQEEG